MLVRVESSELPLIYIQIFIHKNLISSYFLHFQCFGEKNSSEMKQLLVHEVMVMLHNLCIFTSCEIFMIKTLS